MSSEGPQSTAICFPKVKGATDCHWAVYNGIYWIEQACRAGAINVWATLGCLLEDVYGRQDANGKVYVKDSHFFFAKLFE